MVLSTISIMLTPRNMFVCQRVLFFVSSKGRGWSADKIAGQCKGQEKGNGYPTSHRQEDTVGKRTPYGTVIVYVLRWL